MGKLKLRGKDLIRIGYPQGRIIGVAINTMLKAHPKKRKDTVLQLLKDVLENPEHYADDETLGVIVQELTREKTTKHQEELRAAPKAYRVFGAKGIEAGANWQMDIAMRLPIAIAGALMPDAHQGYGLPIGGVLATENAVIPYGVGMDIGCRMCLTIYDLPEHFLDNNRANLKEILIEHTRFGREAFERPMDDAVLERSEFKDIKVVKDLKRKAHLQIGSSGSGNHFVEFGLVSIQDENNEFGLPAKQYVGILSHSGSRGLGASIAKHYTKIAKDRCLLPKEADHLAWLSLDSQEGVEYWLAMNLAGDYASACHHHIHRRLGKAIGEQPLAVIENHHNFAWKEKLSEEGREVIVHRKGATPASKGRLGIIPGSMTAPAYIVRGKGNRESLNSAAHGAGRQLSRRKAKAAFSFKELKQHLKAHQVALIGGGMDEAPFAYKDIDTVMQAQRSLVDVLGTFVPRIVRMDK